MSEGGGDAVGVDGLDGSEDGAAPRAVMLVEPHQEDQHDALPRGVGFGGWGVRPRVQGRGCGLEGAAIAWRCALFCVECRM